MVTYGRNLKSAVFTGQNWLLLTAYMCISAFGLRRNSGCGEMVTEIAVDGQKGGRRKGLAAGLRAALSEESYQVDTEDALDVKQAYRSHQL